MAETDRGAMAEFFRRSPDLLDFQDELAIALYELDLEVADECLDTRTSALQAVVGITHERLTSSDSDENIRYADCRNLSLEAVSAGLVGIYYPSAAATWPTAFNLVLFGHQSSASWQCLAHREVDRPRMTSADVNPLPA